MKKYLTFFKIRFIAGLQYRAAAWAGVATQFFWGGMTLLLFRAFYENNPSSLPMSMTQLSSYIWLQQALLALFMAWYLDNEIFDMITSGAIACELCRPADIYSMWFAKNMAVRMARVVLRCVPILAFAVFLPAPFGLSAPASLAAGLLFPVSLAAGFLMLVAFSMLVYISAFYTISPLGVRILATSTVEFFSGALIPLPFFPDGLREVLFLLPFGSMQNTPLLLYTGVTPVSQALLGILLQLFWLAALILAGKLLMRRALRRVVVQGG